MSFDEKVRPDRPPVRTASDVGSTEATPGIRTDGSSTQPAYASTPVGSVPPNEYVGPTQPTRGSYPATTLDTRYSIFVLKVPGFLGRRRPLNRTEQARLQAITGCGEISLRDIDSYQRARGRDPDLAAAYQAIRDLVEREYPIDGLRYAGKDVVRLSQSKRELARRISGSSTLSLATLDAYVERTRDGSEAIADVRRALVLAPAWESLDDGASNLAWRVVERILTLLDRLRGR